MFFFVQHVGRSIGNEFVIFCCPHKLSPTDCQFQPVALAPRIDSGFISSEHTEWCPAFVHNNVAEVEQVRNGITLRGVACDGWGLGLSEPRWPLSLNDNAGINWNLLISHHVIQFLSLPIPLPCCGRVTIRWATMTMSICHAPRTNTRPHPLMFYVAPRCTAKPGNTAPINESSSRPFYRPICQAIISHDRWINQSRVINTQLLALLV